MTDPRPRPLAALRGRAAVALLRTAADLARQRQALIDRLAAQPDGPGRDRAIADLALGARTESAMLWLGWRLLPGDTLGSRLS